MQTNPKGKLENQVEALKDMLEQRDNAIREMDRQRLVVVAFIDEYFKRENLILPQLEKPAVLCEPFKDLSWEELVMMCRCFYDIMLSTSTVEGLLAEGQARSGDKL